LGYMGICCHRHVWTVRNHFILFGEANMKIRIRKSATTKDMWYIDVKPWWSLKWKTIDETWGVDSQARALDIAQHLARPTIIMVKP